MKYKPLVIYFAHYDSRNFSFEAFGVTAVEAKNALIDGLKLHAIQYADRLEEEHWWFDEDIWIDSRIVGECYRDRSLMENRNGI
jgi:hypothetical protein